MSEDTWADAVSVHRVDDASRFPRPRPREAGSAGPSLGSYVYVQVSVHVAIMAAVMNTFFVTRHACAEAHERMAELALAFRMGDRSR